MRWQNKAAVLAATLLLAWVSVGSVAGKVRYVKQGMGWEEGTEMRLWERKDLWSHPCRVKTFLPRAAHRASSSTGTYWSRRLSSLWSFFKIMLETRGPILVGVNALHLAARKRNGPLRSYFYPLSALFAWDNMVWSTWSAISKCSLIFSLIFSLKWFESSIIHNQSLAVIWLGWLWKWGLGNECDVNGGESSFSFIQSYELLRQMNTIQFQWKFIINTRTLLVYNQIKCRYN